jgi:hypothetical protein
MPAFGSPTFLIRARIVSMREGIRFHLGHLLPAKWRRGARILRRADRVGGGDRPVARVLAVIDEDAASVGHLPRRRGNILIADPSFHLLRQGLCEATHLGERELRPDGNLDVEPGRAGGLREARQVELVQHHLDHERDRANVIPRIALAGIEVDEHVVGALDVFDPAVPRMQIDAAEVGDPREARPIGHDGEVGCAPTPREDDVHRLEPVRMRARDTLLVEEEPVDAVGVAQHLHGPAPDVRKEALGHVEVVANEVALRQPVLGEEDFLEVRELDFVPTYSHGHEPSARARPQIPFQGDSGLLSPAA